MSGAEPTPSGALTAPAVCIDITRQVHVIDRLGRRHPLSSDQRILWASWEDATPKGGSYLWPTWSPDGRYIATFCHFPTGAEMPRVTVFEVGGVVDTELLRLDHRLPIYLHWSPDGQWLAVMSQDGSQLFLSTARLAHVGHEVRLAQGSPLFFTWLDDGRLAAFVGDGRTGELLLLDPEGVTSPVVLPGTPGNFCAPVWSGERLYYVTWEKGRTSIVAADVETGQVDELEEVVGLVGLVASPDGRFVARALAPGGDGTPYRHLAVFDTSTGKNLPIADHECLAFFWIPGADALLVSRVDMEQNVLRWDVLGLDGNLVPIAETHPTRDMGFYLRFFEQYSQSHPLVDPTGRWVLLSGGLVGHGGSDSTPHLWLVPLGGGEPHSLGYGLFGAWGPTSARIG